MNSSNHSQDLKTTNVHTLSAEETVLTLNTSIDFGLSENEVITRKEKYGPNKITLKKGTHPLVLFFLQFNQPLIYILLGASIVTFVLKEYVDSAVILGVVLVNAIIGFIQEFKALKAIDALAKALTTDATVIRAGKKQRIPTIELTIGDIVLLQSGDKAPADLRLLKAKELQIDESALTGESVPVAKKTEALASDTVLGDRTNMAFSSALVTYGTGVGVVIAIGNETQIGKINQMIASADILLTPLTKNIHKFSKILLVVILALAGITFAVGVLRGYEIIDMFLAAVALAVGAIPEGLSAAITILLAIGVSKMAKRNAIIRKLPAVETLGSTSVICSDKTGTLTQNQMTVQEIFCGNKLMQVSGVGYSPKGEITENGNTISLNENSALKECLISGLLCNDTNISEIENSWKVEGDPTEASLIAVAQKAKFSQNDLNKELPRLDVIPFESQHQYMVTLNSKPNASTNIAYLKGSIESVSALCTETLLDNDKRVPFDINIVNEQASSMAKKGLRVLAFASCEMPSNTNSIQHSEIKKGWLFLGLQAMIDPPRPESIAAVATCKSAGIQVKMITGDHEITALAIAKKIGIVAEDAKGDLELVLNGKAIAKMSDEELIPHSKNINVFARVAPEDKLRLVKALQNDGSVIAMTGDGVNDAPSLKQANIGIAMGINGTEVAKESSDMILTDDNFATITAAVEEGRSVYDNLVKFITWTLPTNFGEGLVIMLSVVLGLTLPILPVQILWINMTTAICLGLMLAFEPKEQGIMLRSPRPAGSSVLTPLLGIRIAIVGTLMCIAAFTLYNTALSQGRGHEIARTLAVNIFVFCEIAFLFNCRSLRIPFFKINFFSNPHLLFGVLLMIIFQLIFTYAPAMNIAFHTAPLIMKDWALIGGSAIALFVTMEIVKTISNRFK